MLFAFYSLDEVRNDVGETIGETIQISWTVSEEYIFSYIITVYNTAMYLNNAYTNYFFKYYIFIYKIFAAYINLENILIVLLKG